MTVYAYFITHTIIKKHSKKLNIHSNALILLKLISEKSNKGYLAKDLLTFLPIDKRIIFTLLKQLKDKQLLNHIDKKYYLSNKAIQAIKEFKLSVKRDLKTFNK